MPYPKPPNKLVVQARERAVLEGRLIRGMTLQTLADELGLSVEGVRKIEQRIRDREAAELKETYHSIKATHHLRNEWVWSQSVEAYLKSKQPSERAREKEKDGETVVIRESVEREGNPVHLQVGMQALAADRELLGLNVENAPNVDSIESEIRELDRQAAEERQRCEVSKVIPPPAEKPIDGKDQA